MSAAYECRRCGTLFVVNHTGTEGPPRFHRWCSKCQETTTFVPSSRESEPAPKPEPEPEMATGMNKTRLDSVTDSVLDFFKTAATEGAKDGASHTAVEKARDIVKARIGPHYPEWLQRTLLGQVIDDILIPTALFLSAELFPTLPHADTIKSVAGRAARVAFQKRTSDALEHLTPMFDDIGRAIAAEVDAGVHA